jgi:outer membrane lipoprotein-sorting protein
MLFRMMTMKMLMALMAALFALATIGCSSADGNAAAARAVRQMNEQGGPN